MAKGFTPKLENAATVSVGHSMNAVATAVPRQPREPIVLGGAAIVTTTVVVLNSWKEISSYLGRSVRTVQRWEADLGLPVRRPRAHSRSAVIAMSDELDVWLRSAPAVQECRHPSHEPELLQSLRERLREHSELQLRCRQLRGNNRRLLCDLRAKLELLVLQIEESRRAR